MRKRYILHAVNVFLLLTLCACDVISPTANTPNLVAQLKDSAGWINSLSWSPDNTLLAVGSRDGGVRIWDVTNHRIRLRLPDFNEVVTSVNWSPNNEYLAVGSIQSGDTLRIWKLAGPHLAFQGNPNSNSYVSGIIWSPDNKNLAVGLRGVSTSDNGIIIYDTSTWHVLLQVPTKDPVTALAWRPNGQEIAFSTASLASNAGTVFTWNIDSKRLSTFYSSSSAISAGDINSISWSPDGKLLAAGFADGNLRIWDMLRNRILNTIVYEDEIKDLTWSPDSQRIAFGGWSLSDDVPVKVWSLSSNQVTLTFPHKDNVNAIAWSPNGNYIASGTQDGIVWLWKVK
jgi:WD40 repeat protein